VFTNGVFDLLHPGHVDLLVAARALGDQSPVALAIKAGAPRPSIDSEDDVKAAVTAARSVGYSTGPSGDHLLAVLDRWGVRAAMQDRIVQAAPGVPVATLVATGQVELGFQQLSELMNAEGSETLGSLPSSMQHITIFAGGIARASAAAARARQVLAFMAASDVAALKRRHGMEPP
jgi:molybdate transport system substrate-binding protein